MRLLDLNQKKGVSMHTNIEAIQFLCKISRELKSIRHIKCIYTTGVVTSPNYPHCYPPNLYPPKRQTIRAEQGLVLVLEFTAFETNCYSDHLTIEDGDGTTLVERECGVYGQNYCDLNGQIQCRENLPPVIRSRSNIVHLDFQTNSNIEFSGWSLNWKAVTPRV